MAAIAVAAAILMLAAPAALGSSSILRSPAPSWYTPTLAAKVHAAGAQGVQIPADELNTACPGVQTDPGVSAGGCIVAPYGCTANFIYGSGLDYIGTASHCTDNVGQPVVMQVDTTTIAEIGTVAKRTSQQVPGNDFALIAIDPAVKAQWGVNPRLPVVGGPNGIYTGCGPVGVEYYGHGYVVAVGQGKPEGGLATNFNNDGYGWTGVAAPGDSGSGVITTGGQAAGNLTHLIVDIGNYPGSNTAGTRITKILQFAGVPLVNADGSTTSAAATNC